MYTSASSHRYTIVATSIQGVCKPPDLCTSFAQLWNTRLYQKNTVSEKYSISRSILVSYLSFETNGGCSAQLN